MRSPHLGRGVPFPFRPVGGRIPWVEAEAAVERSLADILETSPGERVMNASYGAGLQDFLFQPNTDVTRAAIAARVRDRIVALEPRVTLERVSVVAGERANMVLIDVDFVVRATNTAHNRVYPFYLTEGS